MKNHTLLLLGGLIVAIGVAAISLMTSSRSPTTMTEVQAGVTSQPATDPAIEVPASPVVESAPSEAPAGLVQIEPRSPASIGIILSHAPVPQPAGSKKSPRGLNDPVARVAMSLVGADPGAEVYWLEAIYDTRLPEAEREDLMEDLNEGGLSDSKHPGREDIPVIINRIAIIEEVMPHADEFMQPHLWEAYKDLINLAEVAQGGGQSVR